MAVSIYITVFMDVTLYRLVGGYQHSKGARCLHLLGLNEKCEDAVITGNMEFKSFIKCQNCTFGR